MIEFKYKTHRGTIEQRTLVGPFQIALLFNPGFGYQPGWFISGSCPERGNDQRSFALTQIVIDGDQKQGAGNLFYRLAEFPA